MKRMLTFALACALALAGWTAHAAALPDVNAAACALVDATTGRVIYQKNGDARLPMASTTKIMTALLAIEKGNLEDVVVVDKAASGVEGSSMYLGAGEHITLENLLYGLMLWSGNDAAVAIAIHIAGSVNSFVDMMNVKAVELGANDTRFQNPNGLPADGHYTTALDLALIAKRAMENPTFRRLVSTQKRTVDWEGHEWDRELNNKNKMLYQYDGATGIKTGYTKAAGRCLVSSAQREGVGLVSVVLNCPDMYADSQSLLDYGFTQLKPVKLAARGEVLGLLPVKNSIIDVLELVAKDDIVITAREGETPELKLNVPQALEAPVRAGDAIGAAEVWLDGQCVLTRQLFAMADAPERTVDFYLAKLSRDYCAGIFG